MRQVRRTTGISRIIFGMAAVCSVAIGAHSPAYAGSCESGSTCAFELTNSNVNELDGNIDIRVTINNSGSNTVLSLQYISSGLSNTPLGLDMFGYNDATTVSGITGNNSAWTFNFDGTTFDGFGDFASSKNLGPAETGGISGALNFTLNGLVTSFPENDHGAEFVTHIRYDGNCSGFISDGKSTATSSDSGCLGGGTPNNPVPEPTSVLLLGSGLMGIVGWAHRKNKARA